MHKIITQLSSTLTTYGGLRGLLLDTTLDRYVSPSRVPRTSKPSFIDGVVGVRGRTALSEKWSLCYGQSCLGLLSESSA